jgi:hypothetical protein
VAVEGRRQRKLGAGWVCQQIRQIYADYALPIPPGDLTVDEIRFFYVPMIESLCKYQKMGKGKGK